VRANLGIALLAARAAGRETGAGVLPVEQLENAILNGFHPMKAVWTDRWLTDKRGVERCQRRPGAVLRWSNVPHGGNHSKKLSNERSLHAPIAACSHTLLSTIAFLPAHSFAKRRMIRWWQPSPVSKSAPPNWQMAEADLDPQFESLPAEQRRVAALAAVIDIKALARKAEAEKLDKPKSSSG
jgi:hypothetical protein